MTSVTNVEFKALEDHLEDHLEQHLEQHLDRLLENRLALFEQTVFRKLFGWAAFAMLANVAGWVAAGVWFGSLITSVRSHTDQLAALANSQSAIVELDGRIDAHDRDLARLERMLERLLVRGDVSSEPGPAASGPGTRP